VVRLAFIAGNRGSDKTVLFFRPTGIQNTPRLRGRSQRRNHLKPQHFNVAKQPNTATAPPVNFQQGKQLKGSQNWHGQRYSVFRNYKEEWHDKNWWHHHHDKIVFVFRPPCFDVCGSWLCLKLAVSIVR
jgi:hypothetical protein